MLLSVRAALFLAAFSFVLACGQETTSHRGSQHGKRQLLGRRGKLRAAKTVDLQQAEEKALTIGADPDDVMDAAAEAGVRVMDPQQAAAEALAGGADPDDIVDAAAEAGIRLIDPQQVAAEALEEGADIEDVAEAAIGTGVKIFDPKVVAAEALEAGATAEDVYDAAVDGGVEPEELASARLDVKTAATEEAVLEKFAVAGLLFTLLAICLVIPTYLHRQIQLQKRSSETRLEADLRYLSTKYKEFNARRAYPNMTSYCWNFWRV
ncbi:hypothetical protein CYMTET_8751 [Cymbomonas tetramitiformis]|uniref:Uncharacterized protein n=1 Tax=Cymbomonas tetramitiformis TaxID=36881 RepID=A0AAE0GSX3_9CHLO|nr:hypothetical protein CYMTET_8751 [Cymbomonas tetramitiformis]